MLETTFKNLQGKHRVIKNYEPPGDNLDKKTVESFGEEWSSFHDFSEQDITRAGDMYFDIVSTDMMNTQSEVIDIGCGSGRFIRYLKGRCKKIVGVDPSAAIFAADVVVGPEDSVELIQASTDNLPYPNNHFDFGYSLGVLHHIPDTQKALTDCIKKIKPGGYFLLYLYYSLDNRSWLFNVLFHLSNIIRRTVSKFPARLKRLTCDILAIVLYMPFVLLRRFLKAIGLPEKFRRSIPLVAYESQSFYIIRNDSLDRFGTPLEQRFSRKEIEAMMQEAGLTNIIFSEKIPYWHAVGQKK